MLSRVNRLRRSEEFRRTVRRGSRASSATLVVHLVSADDECPRVGFVVSRAVGGAAVRQRVKRRLRHAVRPHLGRLGASLVVVRALPRSAGADFAQLSLDLDRCLTKLEGRRA